MNPQDTRLRRGLIGLAESGRPPVRPREVKAVTYQGLGHQVKRQTGRACVNGIDKWWVETCCGQRLVVTTGVTIPAFSTCIICAFG